MQLQRFIEAVLIILQFAGNVRLIRGPTLITELLCKSVSGGVVRIMVALCAVDIPRRVLGVVLIQLCCTALKTRFLWGCL